ncbi:MAG: DUF5672 family protein [Tidjanibacter sp.]|nr:DUF5672 family protein [Tidjanibacter sp.]
MQKVTIVIPVYRSTLSDREVLSLRNNMAVLSHYPTVFLLSEELQSPPKELDEFRAAQRITVGREWLGRANGIKGYNRMLLSKSFYELFAESQYILICQTDAWIFRDELDYWCSLDYDYIGGPYHQQSVEKAPIIGPYWRLIRLVFGQGYVNSKRQSGWGRVMNGGLSLRRTDTFTEACDRYADKIEEYCSHPDETFYNEDWFWSMLPDLNYPQFDVARRFAIDTHPKTNWLLLGKQLPFGCHGWWKRRRYRFWRDIIEYKSENYRLKIERRL